MIELFKRNDFANALLLMPYAIVIRLFSIINPQAYALREADGILNEQIFNHLVPSALGQSIVAIFLVFIQANLINLTVNRSKLLDFQSALPGLFYVVLTGFITPFQQLSPALIGMTFLIFAISSVFEVYKKNQVTGFILNAALFCSIATLFYVPYFLAAVALFIEIGVLRSFKLVERFQFIIGLLVLYWIAGSIFFYFEIESAFSFYPIIFGGNLDLSASLNTESIIILIGSSILIMWSLLNYYNYMKKKGIGVRKKIDFFYWFMIFSLVGLFFIGKLDIQFLWIMCLPICLFIGMNFLKMKNRSFAELLHLSFLLTLFFVQFGNLLFFRS